MLAPWPPCPLVPAFWCPQLSVAPGRRKPLSWASAHQASSAAVATLLSDEHSCSPGLWGPDLRDQHTGEHGAWPFCAEHLSCWFAVAVRVEPCRRLAGCQPLRAQEQ